MLVKATNDACQVSMRPSCPAFLILHVGKDAVVIFDVVTAAKHKYSHLCFLLINNH